MTRRGSDDRLVWSTERGGDLRKQPGSGSSGSGSGSGSGPRGKGGRGAPPPQRPPADGIVRVGRETKGRKGKGVTLITGAPLTGDALDELAAELKRRCGTGGTVKDGVIELQGDHRDEALALLEARGWQVKRAGG